VGKRCNSIFTDDSKCTEDCAMLDLSKREEENSSVGQQAAVVEKKQ
jgi:hypothetical protein